MNTRQQFLYLTTSFVAWKSLILAIALSAPGSGYDTSTTLLPSFSKLVRWDAIYYVQTAQRGHVFEQEWAFGKGLSTLISAVSDEQIESKILSGAIVAHISHYLAVLLLWQIATLLNFQLKLDGEKSITPLIAGILCVLSPAGIFLSAPYSESPFACLNMLGFWLYLYARSDKSRASLLIQCLSLVFAGIAFGCATAIRSNGILSGVLFLVDATMLSAKVSNQITRFDAVVPLFLQLCAIVVGGICIATGLIFPQYLAYREYCISDSSLRPWCKQTLPMIYSFVQSHYWGVGFLRYWTFSNIPLFLLAAPCLTLLLVSSWDAFSTNWSSRATQSALLLQIALPQALLACFAITNYHVQIITRLCSGYPWLYIWLAMKLTSQWKHGELSVRFFVLYALVQAGLFASFLPPA